MKINRNGDGGMIFFYTETANEILFHGFYTSSFNKKYFIMNKRIGYSSYQVQIEKTIEYHI